MLDSEYIGATSITQSIITLNEMSEQISLCNGTDTIPKDMRDQVSPFVLELSF